MNAIAALRPPRVRLERRYQPPEVARPAVVELASGHYPLAAFSALRQPIPSAGTPHLLIPETTRGQRRGTSPFFAQAALAWAAAVGQAQVGLPATDRRCRDRWLELAARSDTQVMDIAHGPWARLHLDAHAFALTSIDLPASIFAAPSVIGLLRAEHAREPFTFWSEIVHPNTRLRASVGDDRDRLLVELAAAHQAIWLLDLTPGGGVTASDGGAIVGVTDDVIAAELCVLAARQLSWIRAGFEEPGPWEHPRVQAATELRLGVDTGRDIALRASANDDVAIRLAERLARRIDAVVLIDSR
ncbi:MAG: hypothetical protein DCC58_16230 [Chloroflexi bacterium]|nr:MAG: hypothetical protein DCC58_16230 [Chloroflexota bacterium]